MGLMALFEFPAKFMVAAVGVGFLGSAGKET